MTLREVVWVFDSWDPDRNYPDQVGEIRCCGRLVVMRAGAIACDTCHTVIEEGGNGWRIVRVKGAPYHGKGESA